MVSSSALTLVLAWVAAWLKEYGILYPVENVIFKMRLRPTFYGLSEAMRSTFFLLEREIHVFRERMRGIIIACRRPLVRKKISYSSTFSLLPIGLSPVDGRFVLEVDEAERERRIGLSLVREEGV